MIQDLSRFTSSMSVEERYQKHRKAIMKALQKRFRLPEEGDFALLSPWHKPCDGQTPAPDHDRYLMSATYNAGHDFVRSRIMHSLIDTCHAGRKMKVRSAHLWILYKWTYTDSTVTTLKADDIFAYGFHAMFLYFTKEFCRYHTDHGYTLLVYFQFQHLKILSIKVMLMKLLTLGNF